MALFSLNELNFFFKFILVGQKLTCSQRLLILSYHITEELELYRLVNTCSILSEFKLYSTNFRFTHHGCWGGSKTP